MYTADDLGFPVPEAATEKSAAAFLVKIFSHSTLPFLLTEGETMSRILIVGLALENIEC